MDGRRGFRLGGLLDMVCGRFQQRDRVGTGEAATQLLCCSAKPVGVAVRLPVQPVERLGELGLLLGQEDRVGTGGIDEPVPRLFLGVVH